MNKIRKNKMLLLGVLAAGLAMSAPQSAFADKGKDEKTAQKSDKKQSFKPDVRVNLDGTKVVYNGVTYTLSGDLRGKISLKEKQGDRTDIKAQLNAQGVKVTAPDGTVYNGVGVVKFQAKTDAGDTTFKAQTNVGLIGKGQAPNFRLKLKLRGTIETGDTHQVVLTLDGADMS